MIDSIQNSYGKLLIKILSCLREVTEEYRELELSFRGP